jgi:hypothetical protein
MNPKHRLALLCWTVLSVGCLGPPEPGELETQVAQSKDALFPPIPFCLSATFAGGALSERVDLAFAGDRTDVSRIDRSLSAPSSLYSGTSVTANVTLGDNWAELFALPFSGYAAGGANLVLEVRNGSQVLCTQRQQLFSFSTPAGKLVQGGLLGPRTINCSFSSTGLTVSPVADVALEVWGAAGGLASAYVHADANVDSIAESRCIHFTFISP